MSPIKANTANCHLNNQLYTNAALVLVAVIHGCDDVENDDNDAMKANSVAAVYLKI